jgi:hypothetical protein
MEQIVPLPSPLPRPEPTAPAVFLLEREQIAWVRAHGGRSASAFMRRLLSQLIEEEQLEIQRLQAQLRQRAQGRGRRADRTA